MPGPADLSLDRQGVRVEKELGRIAAEAGGRLPGPVHAVSIALTGPDTRQVPVPAVAGHLGQLDALLAAILVEEAEVDPLGDLAEHAEVRAATVVGRAEPVRLAGPKRSCACGLVRQRHDGCRTYTVVRARARGWSTWGGR
jgi:hypothetical protein